MSALRIQGVPSNQQAVDIGEGAGSPLAPVGPDQAS